ncbi:MAG: nitronate monooxygenase [Acidimicrobiales bacterium]|nr:nitronate monooxygenase [Acidimicrobiales bacterium]
MKNDITELFGIDIPLFAFSHCRDVVAAVTKAGGMGVLGAVAHSDEQLEIDLDWIEAEVGDRPYGVDLIIPARYLGDDEGGYTAEQIEKLIPSEHKTFVADILARYGVPEVPDDDGRLMAQTGDVAFSLNRATTQLEISLARKAIFLVNALGPPPQHMVQRVKEEGRIVGALAGKAQHAQRHVNAGVDVIIAQGSEAGGHTGEIGTMVLIPEVVDAVAPVPVLAAGGIGRGRQMAAAMALGAQGVWCGSVWLTTEEAETHPAVKQKFLAATSSDTIRSRSRTGKHARMLKSAWTDEWENPANPAPLGMPMQPMLVDDAIRRIDRAAHTAGTGAEQLANYFVGQIVGDMNRSKPARQVVVDMVDEFIDATRAIAAQIED